MKAHVEAATVPNASHSEAADASNISQGIEREQLPWMSQWTSEEEEELIADYDIHLRAPWAGNWMAALAGAAVIVATGTYGLVIVTTRYKADALLPCYQKSHLI